MREVAKAIGDKLEKLKNIQQQITNKTKEVSRRDESRPEDIATTEQIRADIGVRYRDRTRWRPLRRARWIDRPANALE